MLDDIGAFRWWPSVDRWYWNDALFRLHGHEPGAVTPSRAALLELTHPRDRARIAEAVAALVGDRRPYCTRHRIVTTDGRSREVVGAGGPARGGDGGETALLGYVIPLDVRTGALPLDEYVLPGPEDLTIPVPRGRDGTPPAEPVVVREAAGEAAVPAVRTADAAAPDVPDGRHAELLRRAHDTLVSGLDLNRDAAAAVVAWLANTHEVPPVVVAESLADLGSRTDGRPDLAALLTVLDDGPDA